MRLSDAQLALALLSSLCVGDPNAIRLLRELLRQLSPTLIPHFWVGHVCSVASRLSPGGNGRSAAIIIAVILLVRVIAAGIIPPP
jgi:uncharacterized integral membrane protein